MSRHLKRLLTSILLVAGLQSATAQTAFIDSIRTMLLDLDSSIQHPQLNSLLKHTISYCSGDCMNDTLRDCMGTLISEEYLLEKSLRQPVSPHLLKKYLPFILRICKHIEGAGAAADQNENRMRQALVMLAMASDNNHTLYLNEARLLLSQTRPADSFQLAKWNYYYSLTFYEGYFPDSASIYISQSLCSNPNDIFDQRALYAKVMFRLGTFSYEMGRRDAAFGIFQQHLALRELLYGAQSAEYAFWLIVTADQFTYLVKYDLAQTMNFRAEEITRATVGEFSSQYALCLNDIAEVYYRMGQYYKSLPYALRSLAIKRKLFGNAYFDNVVSLHNLATLYMKMGLYSEAIPLLEESLQISSKYFGERMVYAFDLHPLAEVYTYLGAYEKALPLYLKSKRIQKQIQVEENGSEKNVYYPGMLHSLAGLYAKLGQYNKAISIFEQSLALKKDVYGEVHPEYIKTLNSCAEVYALAGYLTKSLSLQLRSIALTKRLSGYSHPAMATGLLNMASIQTEFKNFVEAKKYAGQALAIQKNIFGESHPEVATTFDVIGDINRKQHHDSAALNYFMKAFSIRQRIYSPVHPSYISSLYKMGEAYARLGSFRKAAHLFMEADSNMLMHLKQSYITLSEEEKLTYLKNLRQNFYFLPALLYQKKVSEPSIASSVFNDMLILRSMLLFQQQQMYVNIRTNADTTITRLFGEWRLNRSFLGRQYLLAPKNRVPDLDSIQNATTEIEQTLSNASASFENSNLNFGTNVSQVRSSLSKGEAAIEFIRFRLYLPPHDGQFVYAALIVLPGRHDVSFIPLASETQLEHLLQYSNNTGEASVSYLYPPALSETATSKRLFNFVWKPLLPYLKNVNTIYYVPTGLLLKLSFVAMHNGKGGFVSDRYQLKQLLSTRSLVLERKDKTALQNGIIWGDISYGKSRSSQSIYLPGTKEEVAGISSIMYTYKVPCEQLTRGEATEKRFKAMDGKSPSFIHIASHGFYTAEPKNENPMLRSGVMLAKDVSVKKGDRQPDVREDGMLTAYEVAQLDLSKTQLVVLSACKTGLGDIEENEGVYGLQRAFKMAGAKHVLTSLWSIADSETAGFMRTFYKYLMKTNDAAEALRLTRQNIRKKFAPYFWGGFELIE